MSRGPDHPVRVGEVDRVAVDRPGEVDERGARPELGVGEHGRFDRRLDVGKIGGRDRLEQDSSGASASGISAKRALVPPMSPMSTGKARRSVDAEVVAMRAPVGWS